MKKIIILSVCLFSATAAEATCPSSGQVLINNTDTQSFIAGLAAQGESSPSAQTACIAPGSAQSLWPASTTTSMTVFVAPCNTTNWTNTGANSNFNQSAGYIWNCTSSSCSAGSCAASTAEALTTKKAPSTIAKPAVRQTPRR